MKFKSLFISLLSIYCIFISSENNLEAKHQKPACCKTAYGNFYTLLQNNFNDPIPQGVPIPFDLVGIDSKHVKLVIDQTFNLNGVAVAVSKPGIYLVSYGLACNDVFGSQADIKISINGVLLPSTDISIGISQLSGTTTILKITADDLKNGQNHAALIEVIPYDDVLYLGTLSDDNDDITAYITLALICPL